MATGNSIPIPGPRKPIVTDESFTKALFVIDRMVEEADDEGGHGLVYFVAPRGGGPIKIGHTKNVEQRLTLLQSYCPFELELVGCAPGSKSVEGYYHSIFVDDRLHGEWFHPSERLLAECKRLAERWIG